MTIIDREVVAEPRDRAAVEPATVERPPAAREDRRTTPSWSPPALIVLAALSAAAGAIHFAMTPVHASEWPAEGLAFAAVGWFQVGVALVLVARPAATVLRVTAVVNVAFVGIWTVSRIWGLPVGPEAGIPHPATFVDLACVALEVALVIGCYELLVNPARGSKLTTAALVPLSIIPLGAVILSTVAIVSPSAIEHDHGTSDAAGGHTHAHSEEAAAPVDDKGLSLIMNGAGEGGGHVHSTSTEPLDTATQAALDAQLSKTKVFIDTYPTVAAAEAAGYHRMGPYSPALGAHYGNATGLGGVGTAGPLGEVTDGVLNSPTLIYDGTEPSSRLAGFMYNVFSTDTQTPPEGFAGPNDHWHYHTNVCITVRPDGGVDAPLGADASATKELCDRYNGFLIANTGYMLHVWTVPGYESSQGVFSNLNPKMTCPNGTYYIVPMEEVGTRSNVCRDVPS